MAARTDPDEPGRRVVEQAAWWQAQLADEACDDQSRRAFRQWLDADRAHGLAFYRMSALSGQVARPDRVERAALKMMLDRKPRARIVVALVLAGTVATLAGHGIEDPAIRARIADQRTLIGEQHRITTASGDGVVLDSATAADIESEARTIRLWRGGVMAKVAKGGARPFIVRTPQGMARALGTEYSVRIDGDVTTVSVVESRVEACSITGKRACLILGAGQSARMSAAGIRRVADIDLVAERAWSEGLLFADDRPLGEVIDTLNRYRRDPVRYSRSDLHGLRVSGSFPLIDPDRAVRSLEAAMPIVVERSGQGIAIHRR